VSQVGPLSIVRLLLAGANRVEYSGECSDLVTDLISALSSSRHHIGAYWSVL
jgi:hypothetical protein